MKMVIMELKLRGEGMLIARKAKGKKCSDESLEKTRGTKEHDV